MATAVDPRKKTGIGCKPPGKTAAYRMADGGMIANLKRIAGIGPAETMTQKFARQDAELAAKTAKTNPAPPAAPVAPNGISGYVANDTLKRREQAAGLADGGVVKHYQKGSRSGGKVVGRGDGTVDTVPAKYAAGEYVLPTDTAQAIGYDKLDAIKDATHTPVAEQRRSARVRMADGGALTEDDRRRLVQKIPTTGYPAAPPDDGRSNTDLSRNIQNAGNALGGMGVVASVPLRSAQSVMNAAPLLPNAMPRLAAPASNATNFVAGMGSGAQVTAAPAAAVAQAIPRLPAVNAALQEGAQANALAGVTRGVSNAGALLAGSEQAQSATPVAPVNTTPAAPSEYGRQMGEVGNFLANGAATAFKTIVGAPGYGINRPSTSAASANPAPSVPASATSLGRGTPQRRDFLGDPGSIEQQVKGMGTVDTRQALAAMPVDSPSSGVIRRVGNSYSGTDIGANAAIDNPRNAGAGVSTPGSPGDGRRVMEMNNRMANEMRTEREGREAAQYNENAYQISLARGVEQKMANEAASRSANITLGSITSSKQQKAAAIQSLGSVDRRQEQSAAIAADAAGRGMADATTRRGQDAQNAMANAQNTMTTAKFGLDQRNSDRAGAGIDLDNKAKQRLADVQGVLLDPNATDAQREKATDTGRALQGKYEKEVPNRFTVVPGGQEIDGASGLPVTRPARVMNNQTGQFVEQGQSKPALPPNSGAIAMLKSNPKMAADFDAKYGQGAAARALGQK